jgi:hypothetical protein
LSCNTVACHPEHSEGSAVFTLEMLQKKKAVTVFSIRIFFKAETKDPSLRSGGQATGQPYRQASYKHPYSVDRSFSLSPSFTTHQLRLSGIVITTASLHPR